MKKLVTYDELHRQLAYDPLTGLFYWKVSNSNRGRIGNIAGSLNTDGYIRIGINHRRYLAHRLAWFYVHGYYPENRIDHKDQIRHHNWIKNLREASQSCNIINTGNLKNNTSGIKGVGWHKQNSVWQVNIKVNQKRKNLGYYKNFDNAVCARLAGEQCLEWEKCNSNSSAYKYVQENIINV